MFDIFVVHLNKKMAMSERLYYILDILCCGRSAGVITHTLITFIRVCVRVHAGALPSPKAS